VLSPSLRRLAGLGLITLLAGCGTPPQPVSTAAPGSRPSPAPETQAGAPDSTAPVPGSAAALYRFRFVQLSPASEHFTFQDRDLSFYFRPAPDALHFQVENRQNQPVWIDWDRSTFYDPLGSSGKPAHEQTRWSDRFGVQAQTQIGGLQRYSDYVLPLDYLLDPAGSAEQIHRPLLPEDTRAPQYSGRDFGVDLVFRIEDRPRTYAFHFRVASVIPR
jgi:hypothetical protein